MYSAPLCSTRATASWPHSHRSSSVALAPERRGPGRRGRRRSSGSGRRPRHTSAAPARTPPSRGRARPRPGRRAGPPATTPPRTCEKSRAFLGLGAAVEQAGQGPADQVVAGEVGRDQAHVGEEPAHPQHDHREAQPGEQLVVRQGVGRPASGGRPVPGGLGARREPRQPGAARPGRERPVGEQPPAEVEQRIADARHLPVEDRSHLEVAVDEVAEAGVAPHQARPLGRLGWPVAAQHVERSAGQRVRARPPRPT